MNLRNLLNGLERYVDGLRHVVHADEPADDPAIEFALDTLESALDAGDYSASPQIERAVNDLYCALADLTEAIAAEEDL